MNDSLAFNIYCDESCHLPHDGIKPMLLGCVWTKQSEARSLGQKLQGIKVANGLSPSAELKWSKVSSGNLAFYLALIDWFFKEPRLKFRVLVIPNKLILDHATFNNGSADEFYYKMYFWLLNKIVSPDATYKIYLDVKDTRSRGKIKKLRETLCFDKYDFAGKMIEDIRCIRSHEAQLIQLADFLIGAVAYKNRGLENNKAKLEVIKEIESQIRQPLNTGTKLFENKFNIFIWTPRGKNRD